MNWRFEHDARLVRNRARLAATLFVSVKTLGGLALIEVELARLRRTAAQR